MFRKGKKGPTSVTSPSAKYCCNVQHFQILSRPTCLPQPLYGGGGGQQKVYKVAGRLWWRCLEETRRSCSQKGCHHVFTVCIAVMVSDLCKNVHRHVYYLSLFPRIAHSAEGCRCRALELCCLSTERRTEERRWSAKLRKINCDAPTTIF